MDTECSTKDYESDGDDDFESTFPAIHFYPDHGNLDKIPNSVIERLEQSAAECSLDQESKQWPVTVSCFGDSTERYVQAQVNLSEGYITTIVTPEEQGGVYILDIPSPTERGERLRLTGYETLVSLQASRGMTSVFDRSKIQQFLTPDQQGRGWYIDNVSLGKPSSLRWQPEIEVWGDKYRAGWDEGQVRSCKELTESLTGTLRNATATGIAIPVTLELTVDVTLIAKEHSNAVAKRENTISWKGFKGLTMLE